MRVILMKKEEYPEIRNLDDVYFRVKRDGKYVNRCFTDLTAIEQHGLLNRFDEAGKLSMCIILANALRLVGDQLDIAGKSDG